MKFWNFTNIAANETESESVELRIEGDIIDNDDVWFYEMLGVEHTVPNMFKDELSKHKNKPITLWINSNGGSVFAATGIYNALMERKGDITVKIEKALSAASVLATAGGRVLMSPMGMYMIQNPLTVAMGDMHELSNVATVLDKVKDMIMNAYQLKTGRSRKRISDMMDAETFMDVKAAIKDGFVDEMLYSNSEEPIKNFKPNMTFSMASIQNSAKLSIEKLINIQKELDKPQEETAIAKAKLELKLKI